MSISILGWKYVHPTEEIAVPLRKCRERPSSFRQMARGRGFLGKSVQNRRFLGGFANADTRRGGPHSYEVRQPNIGFPSHFSDIAAPRFVCPGAVPLVYI
jgi:hypothetical protein